MKSIFVSLGTFKNEYNHNEWILNNPRSACISIVTEDSDKFLLNKEWEDSIQLVFQDIDDKSDPNSFSEEQAKLVLDFIESNKELDYIVIHCLAGQSRSAAISLFIEEYYNDLKVYSISRTKFVLYNRMVFQRLLQELFNRKNF